MQKIQAVLMTIWTKIQKIKDIICNDEDTIVDCFLITDNENYEETVIVDAIENSTDIILTFQRSIKLENGKSILSTYSSHILPAIVAEKLYTILFKAKHHFDDLQT